MADLEKVIKAIEDCVDRKNDCEDCDYDGCVFKHGDCRRDLLADALELLKEQRAVIEKYHTADSFLEVHGWKWEKKEEKRDCRDCWLWLMCPNGMRGHLNGTSIGFSIGECKDFRPVT